MWTVKCRRNVIVPSVQRHITIIIVSYKFIFFICGCQKLFKNVSIIILPLWQGKKNKGQAVPSSFRRLGSFYRQQRQRMRKIFARRWVTFWKGQVLSVTPMGDVHPGEPWCLAGASARHLRSARGVRARSFVPGFYPLKDRARNGAQLPIPTLMLCPLFFFLKYRWRRASGVTLAVRLARLCV